MPAVRPIDLDSVQNGAITSLVDALRMLSIDGEITLDGRWLTLHGNRCPVYIVQATTGEYLTWCDDPAERTAKAYRDPCEAIVAGLQRAARHETEERSTDERPSSVHRTFPDD